MLRLALPLLRRPLLVLPAEPLEVFYDVVLREVFVLAHLLYEQLDVPAVRLLSFPAFTRELGLPTCLLGHEGRVRSLGRLDGCSLRRIVYRQLEDRLGGGDDWLGWSAGVDLECGLRDAAHLAVLDSNKYLLDILQFCSVNGPFPEALLGKVVERGDHLFLEAQHLVVLEEAMVLLCLHVPSGVRDVLRLDVVRAVPAVEDLPLLIERQTLPLELRKGVFPGGAHAKRYLFNN